MPAAIPRAELDAYLSFATGVARQAGRVMLEKFKLGMHKQWKADRSPLTEADIAVNDLVLKSVADAYPDHAVIAEEGSALQEGARLTWVCDPIDGTLPFSHGVPTYVFLLALVQDGQPLVGVVHDPAGARLVTAVHGGGTRLNGQFVRTSAKDLTEAVIGVEVSELKVPGIRQALESAGAKGVSYWGSGFPGMLVGLGEFGAVFSASPYPHDSAALKVIIEEAGGTFTSLAGKPQRYDQPTDGFIGSNGVFHDQLLELVQANRADHAS